MTHETKHFIYFYLGQVAILLVAVGGLDVAARRLLATSRSSARARGAGSSTPPPSAPTTAALLDGAGLSALVASLADFRRAPPTGRRRRGAGRVRDIIAPTCWAPSSIVLRRA